jgi:hypothetical protein
MHYPQITHWRQEYRHGQFRAKDSSPQIARWHGDGLARSKRHRVKRATVFAKCPLAFCSAIDVVKNNSRNTSTCQLAQILNVHSSRNARYTRAHLAIRTGTDGDNVICGRTVTDILDAVLFIRVNEAYTSGTDAVGRAIDREFDCSFADKPHLRVHVMMRRMRGTIWGQRRLMGFNVLTGCQLASHDFPYLRVLRVLHRHILEWKRCRR